MLEREDIVNLKHIYDSDKQSIHKKDFVDEYGELHPNPSEVISRLLTLYYIENERNEDVFFLTNYGYEFVENQILKHSEPNTVEFDSIESFDVKRFKKYIFIWLFLFGLLVTFFFYFFPNTFSNNQPKKEEILNKETLQHLNDEIKEKVDSLNNLKKK